MTRLNTYAFAIGCAAAGVFAIVIRAVTAGIQAEYWWLGLLWAIAFVIFSGVLGAIVALVYNAVASR